MGGQSHAPAALPPGKRRGTHCTGGWVGPRASLDGWRKSRPPPGFDPRTVQPVASRYADIAISCEHSNSKSVDILTQFFLECVNKEQMCKQRMATCGLPRPDIRLEILIHERKYYKKKKTIKLSLSTSIGE